MRGRAFVAAGVTAVACAVVLGQETLAGAGVLALTLPLASLAVVHLGRLDVHLSRSVEPSHLSVGATAVVRLTLTTTGRVPGRTLLLDDRVPHALGARPRLVLRGVGRHWRGEVTYAVRSDLRGRYETGPLLVRAEDAFGMVQVVRRFRRTTDLVVRPRTVPLPDVALGGGSGASGDDRPRAAATGSTEDVMVREYRRGDDLRRVHWRSTARTGELMVRREEQPWQAHATVLLDDRAHAHAGDGAASSLEHAIVAAASVCTHLARRGYAVALADAEGRVLARSTAGSGAGGLLDALAGLGALEAAGSPETPGAPGLVAPASVTAADPGVTVAVLGRPCPGDEVVLERVARASSSALALRLDVDRWAAGAPAPVPGAPPLPGLPRHGWRTALAGPADPLAEVWVRLGARWAPDLASAGGPR
ncbi:MULTISPECIES: DUF58 domain-containing protein [unclassified Nocardioides]|uniref:DUF58 domain-containing protein n=1 Tax=unclassified Nocardioides TaxID=2615069 RepID=UPI002405C8B8|nr:MULTISPECIES: DUF58 domain-containing protein [unclassified Nocardioides]